MTNRRVFIKGCLAMAPLLKVAPSFAQATDLTELSLADASVLIRRGELSPLELTEAYLSRINTVDREVNAYITVTSDLALALARECEAELARGLWRGPLHGIPVALKDNIDTAGIRTTGASTLLQDRGAGNRCRYLP